MAKTAAKQTKKASKPLASKKVALPKLKKPVIVADEAENKIKATPAAPVANATAFEIEDNAYFPPRTRNGKASLYPFATLAVGQTFFIPANIDRKIYKNEKEANDAQIEESHRVANRMAGATRRFTKRNEGFKFSVRTLVDPSKGHGVRIKRVEDGEA